MDQPPLLPIFLRIQGQHCLVVGGGPVAARKLRTLARAGAGITIVAPALDDDLARELESLNATHLARNFRDNDIAGRSLVVAATDSIEINEHIAGLARGRGIPVNVVNQPGAGTFIFPSVVDRDPVTIAVSTGGQAPALARWLRGHLETVIPDRFGGLARLIGRYREDVNRRYPATAGRRRFWERALHGPLSEFLFHNQPRQAAGVLDELLALDPDETPVGQVALVGAGPGDPDLLTFRALRLIQQADVVLYDRLVSPPILDLIPRRAERLYVGKARSDHSVPQEHINQHLIDHARLGKRVLRLKGGDPFIFGRGGEEIDGLARHGIPFQVVPGITAASGCAAYAGIPLTHRDHAQSCILVTGHTRNGTLDLPWDALVQPQQTIVVYMGLTGLDILCRELIRRGMADETPAALVERGTMPAQRVIKATLADLPEAVASAQVHGPTLVIIGSVVRLRDRLGWFESWQDPD
ncbi:MAG: siroheme synthase CysG [Gammaproteobacteria bacterium]|nr:siroheme synthase CysG [Gammaproteobacteria bacterium]